MKKLIFLLVFNFIYNFIFCNDLELNPDSNTIYSWPDSILRKVDFTPDTTINFILMLNSPTSITKNLGDVSRYRDSTQDLPDVYLKGDLSYIRLVFFPGDVKNNVMQFEVGKSETKLNKRYFPGGYKHIQTESYIEIGDSIPWIISKKGGDYTLIPSKEFRILRYEISDFKTNSFLKRYNMPVYFAEYTFKNDKLVKFIFGFEYP